MRRATLLTIDLLLIVAATVFALLLRDNLVLPIDRLQVLFPYLGLTVAAAAVVLMAFGLNRGIWRHSGTSDYLRVIGAVIIMVLCAVALGFLFNRLEGVARSLPLLQGILMVCALIGARAATRLRHAHRSRASSPTASIPIRMQSHEMVLIVGLNAITQLFLRSVQEFAAQRVKVAGLLGNAERHTGRLLKQYKVLGTPEQILSVLRDLEVHGVLIDRIVVAEPFERLSLLARRALIEVEQASNIRLDVFAERIGLGGPIDLKEDANTRILSKTEETPHYAGGLDPWAIARRPYWRIKRGIDICLAAVLIVMLAPVFVLVATLVIIDVGFPTVFWQQRPGASGRPIKLFKFRTMRSAHDQNGRLRTMEERLTVLGKLLRRTRLDELPQLYNVLVGDMSLVGPRPLLPTDQLGGSGNRRLLVRPGLTGWAQINGGRDISPETKTALDLWYIQNASLRLDIKIALGTLRVLMFGEHANVDAIRNAYRDLGIAEPKAADQVDRTRRANIYAA